MRVAVFGSHSYDEEFLTNANRATGNPHELLFLEPRLHPATAPLAEGCQGVCVFVNDQLDRAVMTRLHKGGTQYVALRCAGFNNVDLVAAGEMGIAVARVPAYSPHAVAEHTLALILALNRQIARAHARVREGNFALDGLLGFNLNGKTAGVVGTGKIGEIVTKLLSSFGCRVLAFDPRVNPAVAALGEYVALGELLAASDVITLHCPLSTATRHLVNEHSIATMKPGVMIINTGRGGLIDTRAVIEGLKNRRIGYLGLDVYEEEGDLFFEDRSDAILHDDVFARLLTFPNVLITGHQAFFTREALTRIAETTLANLDDFAADRPCPNVVGVGG